MPHPAKIPVTLWRLAALASLGALGCGQGQRLTEGGGGREAPSPRLPPPTRIDAVFVLESSGVPPEDTVVVAPARHRRVILVRRGPPDNSLFAQIEFPGADSTPVGGADSMRIEIRPLPGRYGVDLDFPADSSTRVMVTFSYALNFVAPDGARARYGSDLAFERALLIARLDPNGTVTFLRTTSPGSDLITATVAGPGRYLVAAPRS